MLGNSEGHSHPNFRNRSQVLLLIKNVREQYRGTIPARNLESEFKPIPASIHLHQDFRFHCEVGFFLMISEVQ